MTVLVIEDDDRTRRLLRDNLETAHTVVTASDAAQALAALSRGDIDVIVTDTAMPAVREGGLVPELRARTCGVPVVLVTDAAGIRAAVTALKAGARHFLGKPVRVDELFETIEDAAMERRLAQQSPPGGSTTGNMADIVAESRSMAKVRALIERAAVHDAPVLLLGESGTGKELLARALHEQSARAQAPFVAVNCSAIPEALLESELFGHRRGAFTDAREDQRGLFQAAHRGTIFLDEIGDMAPSLQGKLLRVLQGKEVHPLGASAPVPVDVRVVAATHRDLNRLMDEGGFRRDLLYRINVIEVRVPPLRERPEDLLPLIARFLDKHAATLGRPGCTIAARAMTALRDHDWPGNVRELENVIERALVLGTGPLIRFEDLPESLTSAERRCACPASETRRLADLERRHIMETLHAVGGNKSAAARVLGLDRKTLYRRLDRYKATA